ncbi:VOC family protein [Streptomyces hygroscopicus]|uniref:VOC family protein n=1 Tax=Streptomyces hygroscopicus TaxID=1912 RepID=UPI003696D42C
MTIDVRHDHVGITLAADMLEPTIAWYSDKLDYSLDLRFSANGSTFTFLSNGDSKIELISAGAEGRIPMPSSLSATHDIQRLHHICLAVADLNDVLARLRVRGVAPFAGPLRIDPIGRRIAFIVDNVGTIIELTAAI